MVVTLDLLFIIRTCSDMEHKEVNVLEFGAVLRRMRKGAGLSQESLAEKLHISRSNISKLESNKLKLSFEDAIRWAHNTNSQDMLVALIHTADPMMVVDSVSQMVGTILLGGLL